MSANGQISNEEANGGAPPHHHHNGGGDTIHVGGTSAFSGGGVTIHTGGGHHGGGNHQPHHGGGGGAKPPGGGGGGGLDNSERNALTQVTAILDRYGLGSLAKVVLGYVKQGYNTDSIKLLIQQTPEWKQRFAGNELRLKKGLAPLDANTYLATEAAYASAIRQAGLPAGFYDGGHDFANWIGGDVSPTEVQQRAQDASRFVDEQVDPATMQAFQNYYGIDKGHIAAYFLDQKRALPILQQMEKAADIGGAALHQGLGLSQDRAKQFAQDGVTAQQAQQAYGQIAQSLPAASALSEIYHKAFGQQDLENELLGGSGDAAAARAKLSNTEQAAFAGGGGAGSTLQDPGYGVAAPTAGKF